MSVPGGGHPQYGRAAVTWPAGNLSHCGRYGGGTDVEGKLHWLIEKKVNYPPPDHWPVATTDSVESLRPPVATEPTVSGGVWGQRDTASRFVPNRPMSARRLRTDIKPHIINAAAGLLQYWVVSVSLQYRRGGRVSVVFTWLGRYVASTVLSVPTLRAPLSGTFNSKLCQI